MYQNVSKSKCSLYLYFLIKQNLLISGEKMLMSVELKACVTWFIYFLELLCVSYNCAKFHHCRIYVTGFREGGPFCSPSHPWAAPKKPILNRVNNSFENGNFRKQKVSCKVVTKEDLIKNVTIPSYEPLNLTEHQINPNLSELCSKGSSYILTPSKCQLVCLTTWNIK